MQLLNTSTPKNSAESGFTVLELLIVLGIITFLGGLGLFLSMDSYRSYSFNYEERLLIGILQRARSQAMANVDSDPDDEILGRHGVCVIDSDYVLFEGDICVDGATFPKAPSITIKITRPDEEEVDEVVFNQLDGSLCTTVSNPSCNVTAPLVITLTGEGKTASISINNEGRIDW